MGPQTWAVCSLLLLPLLAEPTEDSDFYLAGDYLLGGLFTLHANMTGIVHLNYLQVPKCKEYDTKLLGYSLLQAMRFAVQEINSQRRLLPGVQLGYEMVDSCFTSNNIHPVLHFLARDDRLLPVRRDYSSYVPRVVAVIGPDNTEATVTVAHLLSLFLLPQITYSAIGDQLLDKRQFPGVLRTGPGADHHVEALVQLMLHFGWNWVAVLASGDDYGRDNSRLLAERLAPRNICMAFQETLPTPQPHQAGPSPEERRRLQLIVHKLRDSSARVAVVFSPELALHSFFHEVLRHKLTGMVWLASESWAADPVLHSLAGLRRAGTFLGVTARSVPIPGFSDFHARARSPATHGTPPGTTCNQECDACREGTASFGAVLPGLRGAYGVYSAVYAVAHALHSLLGCTETRCSREVVYPWRLLEEIQKVNFTLLGHHVYFNQQGDLPVDLEVAQWLWEPSGTPFRSVAFYDHLKRKLNVTHEVTWHTPNNEIPLSTCSKDCMPGQKKRPVGIHPCCFECVNCDPGTFLNKTADEYECQACPPLMWSDSNDTTCFERRPVFLEWREVPTVILTLLAALGTLGTLGTLLLFWRNFGTPVVRSAGGPLCFLMLGALLAAYAAVPLYVGPPTVARCLWRQALFAACSTVCISCVAVRSFQIACIFRMARRLPRAYTSWLRCRGPYLSVAAVTALKLAFVAGAELTHAATLTTLDGLGDPRVVVLSCSPDYRKGLLLNTGLDLLLAVLGFGFAYAGKELPTSYNEAKFITFCLAFYFSSSVCLCTVMSVYEGVLVTTLDLLVAVLNLLCISLGYFGPKCSVILFYPERNTQAYFHSMIQGYTLGTGTG